MDQDLKRALSDWIRDALPLYAQRESQFATKVHHLRRENTSTGLEAARKEVLRAQGAQRKGEELLKQLEALPNKRKKLPVPVHEPEIKRPLAMQQPSGTPPPCEGELPEAISFEQRLIRIFNDSSASIASEFEIEPFGVANLAALHRGALEAPEFQVMEGGMYRLIRDGENKAYVVPRPSLQLDDARYRSGGIAHLFECSGFERESYWSPIRLVRPATVRDQGGRWQVIHKGELRDGTA